MGNTNSTDTPRTERWPDGIDTRQKGIEGTSTRKESSKLHDDLPCSTIDDSDSMRPSNMESQASMIPTRSPVCQPGPLMPSAPLQIAARSNPSVLLDAGTWDDGRKLSCISPISSPVQSSHVPASPAPLVGVLLSDVKADKYHMNAKNIKMTYPIHIAWTMGGSKVYVCGTFTDWRRRIQLRKIDNLFETNIQLPSGTHRFKFLVDNEWRCSDEIAQATDSTGNLVNYIEVSGDEMALTLESMEKHGIIEHMRPLAGKYHQEIPKFLIAPLEQSKDNVAPPSLPPHLEKVILNVNNTMKGDASVLPNPNHVVLNHLSASSIFNDVLAVSASIRYRRKYVSTILYKGLKTNE